MKTYRPTTIALLLTPAALLAGNASAAEATAELPTVTVTGSRMAVHSFDQPYSIDLLDQRKIGEGQLKVNASEALAGLPGIVALNRQNYAQDLQISSRGFGARSAFGVRGVRLIADGIPATNPDGQGQAATLNLDTAERIEVLRGPFSSIYGNHAGGVIQLFSRDGAGDPRMHIGATGGSWGTQKVDLGAEGSHGSLGYVFDSSHFETNGYRRHSAATRDQSFAKLTLQTDADSRLRLVAGALRQRDTQDPLGLTWTTYQRDTRAVESVATTFNTRKSIDHVQGGFAYERRFGAQQIDLSAYSGTRSVVQYQSIPSGVQANPRHAGGVVDFARQFYGAGIRWSLTQTGSSSELKLTAGAEYDASKDDRRGYQNFVGPSAAPTVLGIKGTLRRNEKDNVHNFDQYLQAVLTTENWAWAAGLRHSSVRFDVDDRYIVSGNGDDSGRIDYRRSTPTLGLTYHLTPTINLYLSAASGFETPTLNELSYSGNGGNFNFNLKPARSRQIETGLKYQTDDGARFNLALFRIRTADELVVLDSIGGRTSYQNAASTLRQGIEIGLERKLGAYWKTRASFARLRAIYDAAFVSKGSQIDAGRRIPGVPATTAYGELAWMPGNGLSVAAEAIYRSRIDVEDSNGAAPAPGFALVNLRLAAEQTSGDWRISEMLRVDNLFDRKYIGSVIVADSNGRFYEPGSGIGWFAGLQAQYEF
ncbi:MAG: TonB-dependent receptor [Rhodocyclaceae bacterium]|nr:TonB-dependent receptor [Rhodocyclaceae bacterium]